MSFLQLLRVLAFLAVCDAVAVLAIVATTPDVRLRCLLSSGEATIAETAAAPRTEGGRGPAATVKGVVLQGVGVVDEPSRHRERLAAAGISELPASERTYQPQAGDLLIELGDRATPTFLDFAAALYRPKRAELRVGAELNPLAPPHRLSERTRFWLVEYEGQRYLRAKVCPRLPGEAERGSGGRVVAAGAAMEGPTSDDRTDDRVSERDPTDEPHEDTAEDAAAGAAEKRGGVVEAAGEAAALGEAAEGVTASELMASKRGGAVGLARFGSPRTVWLPLGSAAPTRLVVAVVWLAIQGGIFLLAWVAYRRREHDAANRLFLVLAAATLVAVVGGSHWWLLATRPLLAVPFLVAASLLPALLAHFAWLFPRPPSETSQRWPLVLLYVPAVSMAVTTVALATLAWTLHAGAGSGETAAGRFETFNASSPSMLAAGSAGESGPAAGDETATEQALLARGIDWTLSRLRAAIYGYAFVAAGYYLLALVLLRRSSVRLRNTLERQHVRWVYGAALVAALPVAYTLLLALTDRSRLALGDAQLTLFAVSLLLGLGYAAGLLRLRRVLLDEVAELGLTYSLLSIGLTLGLAMLAAVVCLVVASRVVPGSGSPALAVLTLTAALLVAGWIRSRFQRVLDARYVDWRYRLDPALPRGTEALVARTEHSPEQLAARAVESCLETLDVEAATFLLAGGEGDAEGETPRREFRRLASRGRPEGDEEGGLVLLPSAVVAELATLPLLQKAPGGRVEWLRLLSDLAAEAVQPIVVEGELVALLALGRKLGGEQFTPEDAAFLQTLSQMTAVSLRSAEVSRQLGRLSDELRSRLEQIDTQQRTIRQLESEVAALNRQDEVADREAGGDPPVFEEIRGRSPALREVLATVRKVAPSEATVLVHGESGTGKELLARALHAGSARSEGPLVSLHCAALSPTLLESELFGHVKGAFTDARADKVGKLEQASGGTLFFDEVGDIPLPVQVKLLRVLAERRLEPVGSNVSREVDVRIVAATHQDLPALIEAGQFREDLYYRLNVVTLVLPPLRERGADVVELAVHCLQEFALRRGRGEMRFEAAAIAALEAFDWPGNIRQLRNVVERASVLAEGSTVRLGDLPAEIREGAVRSRASTGAGDRRSPVVTTTTQTAATTAVLAAPRLDRTSERDQLAAALAATEGNKAAAAKSLGLPRSTFYSKLKKHGLA